MMKLFRSALMAGLLALGVAACGDDVEVVSPAPPVTPPPPPLVASMAPASAEVAVGSSVVFAVNASGGVVGEAASWSCSSSNTGIATASTTSSGCQATGVVAGGVTITATVSKGGETANVGSQLTVTAPAAPPPFEASIAPESQSVAVGSSVVFAVNTSGGHTGMMMDGMMTAASWECSSSDAAIATAATVDAGCEATGLAGGEVTVNVAATDGYDTVNLVAQLTVTTDPVEPTAPFVATMAPESAEVAVGSNVVFAINSSGGAADAVASWVCTSSDEALATASTTDAGCEATGVAAGGVTINAAVTKGDDSASLASSLTVTAPQVGQPAFVLIAGIESEGDAGGALKGTVSVTINVERGDQTLLGLGLVVNGEIVAQQSFGIAMAAPADDEPAEQAIHSFTLSFDSDEYDVETGVAKYENGPHALQAGLLVAGSPDPVASNAVTAEFDNDDGVHVTASSPGTPAMNATTGDLWYGGPDAGDFTITVAPVMFSGGAAVESVTLLGVCGADAQTKSEAPFTFTLECKDSGSVTPEFSISAGGSALLNLEPLNESVFPINLDYTGPVAPTFAADPNGREGNWINGDVDLTGKQAAKTPDGWLVYDEKDAKNTAGVGGYTPQLRWATVETTDLLVNAARAATPSSDPGPLAATAKGDHICFIASAVDALGNESKLPKADALCASDVEDDAATEDVDESAASVIMARVDLTDPTIDWTGASLDDLSRDLTERSYEFRVTDADSKLNSVPVIARVAVRNAKETVCGADDLPGDEDRLGNCENNADGIGGIVDARVEVDLTGSKGDGYYTLTAQSQDKAGNKSEEISRVALLDTDAPVVSMSAAAGSNAKSEADYTISATITDKLSIMDYAVSAAFVADLNDPTMTTYYQLKSSLVDAYNAPDPLTKSVPLGGESVTLPFLSVQEITGTVTDNNLAIGVAVPASALRVVVSDQAGLTDADDDDITPAKATDGAYDTDDVIGVTFAVASDSEPDDSTLEYKAVVTADDNPFDRVLFYATADDGAEGDMNDRRLIATVQEYSARESGGVWTYTARVSADDLYAAVGGEEKYDGNVYAVGVRIAGTIPGGRGSTSTATEYTDTGITEYEDGDVTSTTEEVTSGDGLSNIDVTTSSPSSFGAAEGTTEASVAISMRSGADVTITTTAYEIAWDASTADPVSGTERAGELTTRVNGRAGAAIDVDLTYTVGVNGGENTLTVSYEDGDDTIEIAITATTLTVTTKTPTGETEEIKVSGKPALVSGSTITAVDER